MSPTPRPLSNRALKRERQHLIRELVASSAVTSQHELVDLLGERGFEVTQATVSRDITELGLVKIAHDGRHVYAAGEYDDAVCLADRRRQPIALTDRRNPA